jgi:hypothetical protein
MSTITPRDGIRIFYEDWGQSQPIVFSTAGRSPPTTGTRRCCSSSRTAIA